MSSVHGEIALAQAGKLDTGPTGKTGGVQALQSAAGGTAGGHW